MKFDISHVIDKLFYFIITMIVTLGVSSIRDMAHSIQELNGSVATIIQMNKSLKENVDNHEKRLEYLEHNKMSQ